MKDSDILAVVAFEQNSLDRRFQDDLHPMNEKEYEERLAALDAWAKQQYELPESLRSAYTLPHAYGAQL